MQGSRCTDCSIKTVPEQGSGPGPAPFAPAAPPSITLPWHAQAPQAAAAPLTLPRAWLFPGQTAGARCHDSFPRAGPDRSRPGPGREGTVLVPTSRESCPWRFMIHSHKLRHCTHLLFRADEICLACCGKGRAAGGGPCVAHDPAPLPGDAPLSGNHAPVYTAPLIPQRDTRRGLASRVWNS